MEILGLAGAVVIGASWMLKFIMGRLAEQDAYIKTLTTNHITHSTQAMIDVKNALQEWTGVNRELAQAIRERKL